jgi:hypothetical protein
MPAQQSVGGEEAVVCRRCLGRSLVKAARTARSGQVGCGLVTCRRSTATSCRSTRISAFLETCLRASSSSQLTERARQRAVELPDGFIFGGGARLSTIGPAIQSMRPQIAERYKTGFSFNAVAYVAIGGEREFAEAVAHHQRYYPVLPVPVEQAIHHGPIGKIKDTVAEYAASGLDLLVLMPEVRSL